MSKVASVGRRGDEILLELRFEYKNSSAVFDAFMLLRAVVMLIGWKLK